ncbi:MAG: hypothetical protein P8X47_09955, partial [Ignavibacteriaceae bacterium]
MKLPMTIIASICLTIVSCQNKNNKTKFDNQVKRIEIKTELDSTEKEIKTKSDLQNKTFDWAITQTLKQKLISELQQDSTKIDKDIMQFLDEYSKIVNDFNDILFDLSNYDSLNTLAYAPDDTIYAIAIDFKRKAEANGFNIAQSEGMIYMTKNTDYIKSDIIELLDSTSIEFLNLYCQEIDSICCDDASIIIPEKSLVNRAFLWGNLMDKAQKLEYKDVAESEFNKYISLIYLGQENTPSFDWTTKKFNKNLYDLMNEIREKYPSSRASKTFKEFTELLVQSDFKKTNKID